MAGEKDAKTEAPTPRRRSEARNSGQIAKSQDLSAAVLLLGALITLKFLGPDVWFRLLNVFEAGLSPTGPPQAEILTPYLARTMNDMFRMLAPLMGLLALLALVVMYAQVGLLWTLKPLTPSLKKLNPISGFGRIFSTRSAVMLLINLGKLALVCGVAYAAMAGIAGQVVFAMSLDHVTLVALAASLVFRVGVTLAIVLLILALIDYAYQRFRHEKDLKMTKEEVKDELRSMDGDPIVKRRQREVQMQLASRRLKKVIPEADVVVTNPTHVSVALKYDAQTMASPKVTAKGADYMALRIRQLAVAAGVPIVEQPPLARRLFKDCDVGQEIPESLYQVVAEVLAYVYELTGRNIRPKPVPVS
jgi:flagellar biosynthetic protein FlhB